ncbi:MAG TPA: c-type cytochrome domain-containing protein [Bdellovibrionales bacterium]|nr:c-type cytochrome domain-containing protein [Bdellovibrionales bacterium]
MRLKIRTIDVLTMAVLSSAIGCSQKGDLKYSPEQSSSRSGEPDMSAAPAGLQLINTNCNGCHGTAPGSGNVYDVTNVSHLVSTGLIVPGSPDTSPLFNTIAAGNMPPTGSLAAADIETIRQWIIDGAQQGGGGPLPTPTPPPPLAPSYQSIAANILVPKCVSCHRAGRSQGGVRLDNYDDVRREVRVNNPASSPLYESIESGAMPEGGPVLPANEVAAVLQWIQNGALNN